LKGGEKGRELKKEKKEGNSTTTKSAKWVTKDTLKYKKKKRAGGPHSIHVGQDKRERSKRVLLYETLNTTKGENRGRKAGDLKISPPHKNRRGKSRKHRHT